MVQYISQDELEKLIKEAREAGKDVAQLEETLKKMKSKTFAVELKKKPVKQRIEKTTARGKTVIESTGPAKEEDFKVLPKRRSHR